MQKVVSHIVLTDAGEEAIRTWIQEKARPTVIAKAVFLEAANVIEENFRTGQTPVYELGPSYTLSGLPEHLTLSEGTHFAACYDSLDHE